MADTSGQADIRDLFISRLLKGFADEVLVFKALVTVTPTSAREIRWAQKTSGFLSGVTTTGMTTNIGANMSHLSQPSVVRQTFTRNTSYIREFMHETPLISDQDVKDNMVGLLSVHVRDLVRKIAYDVNTHIFDYLSGGRDGTKGNILSGNAKAAWDSAATAQVTYDVERGVEAIREQNYEPTHLLVCPHDYASMIVEFVETRGSGVPGFSSVKVKDGVITQILGLTVVVSNSVTQATSGNALICNPKQAVTYYQFTGLNSRSIEEPMIGVKIRAKEEGIATLTDPNASYLIKLTNIEAAS
jgi:hypothetical protein